VRSSQALRFDTHLTLPCYIHGAPSHTQTELGLVRLRAVGCLIAFLVGLALFLVMVYEGMCGGCVWRYLESL